MSHRYRPPQPKSSPYITPEGLFTLQKESVALWKKRVEVTVAVTAAAAEGDRSENAEYIYRKKQLREIDRRIRYLQKRLPDLKSVDRVADEHTVYFGAWVSLERENESVVRYRIVGADEIDSDSSKGYISVDSPLARAMLKKQVNDEVVIIIEGQKREYCIIDIAYSLDG
ncbi:MAG: transcription elongation factor GreB [Saprospiraceae bacterium]|jgi:transcription elongation factor GreB